MGSDGRPLDRRTRPTRRSWSSRRRRRFRVTAIATAAVAVAVLLVVWLAVLPSGSGGGREGQSIAAAPRNPARHSAADELTNLQLSSATTACTDAAVLASWPTVTLAKQTVVVPVQETDVPAVTQAAQDGFGGLILFGTAAPSNIGSQLASLRSQVPDHLGLLVMTDEEGGGIQRMANLVGSMPWAQQMGATMTASQIKSLAHSVGSKMAANGVDMDLAPVLDVDGRHVPPSASDPDGYRSFSGTTSVVSADGVAFMQGMQAGGVVPVVKHFPGLGGSTGNTDDGPADTLPWSTLQKVALPPFEAAIRAGAPALMVSNAIVPGFTSVPAVLSSKMVTGELRNTLGFRGLLISDSLSAGAITDAPLSLSLPKASVEALQAGMDMVEYGLSGSVSTDLANAQSIANAVVAAVANGTLSRAALVAAAAQVLQAKGVNLCLPSKGYWLTTSKGNVYNYGNAGFFGSKGQSSLPAPVVGMAATVDGRGYWLVTSKGNVYNFGDAGFFGSKGQSSLPAPVVGMATTPDGLGYWLVTSKGNVYNFGDAGFFGSKGQSSSLPAPVVDFIPTADGLGYWLVTSKGNVYNFGDAGFFGSKGQSSSLPAPIVDIAATPDGKGYWVVTSKGNIYNYGDASFYGSAGQSSLPAPVVGLAPTADGRGYWVVTSKGNVYNYGDAPNYGSAAPSSAPVMSITAD